MMKHHRPLVVIALAWVLGVAVSREFGLGADQQALTLFLVLLLPVTVIMFRARSQAWLWMVLLLVVGLGALRATQTQLPLDDLYSSLEKFSPIRGVIVDYPAIRSDRSSFVVKAEHLPGKVQVFYYHPYGSFEDLRYGDRVELHVELQMPWEFADFDYRGYLLSRDIWAVASVWSARDIEILAREQGHPLVQWGFESRNRLFALVESYLPEPEAQLLKSLLLGDRAELDEEVANNFRDAGVMHVLAVSGLHLGILVGLLWAVLRLLRFSWTASYLVLIPLVLIYLTLVGFKVSLVRAALMFAFIGVGWVLAERGWILRRWIDPLQGLGLAGLIILILTPSALYDVSFQLSFAATAGILVCVSSIWPIIREWRARWSFEWRAASSSLKLGILGAANGLFSFFAISAAAQVAVAPVLGVHFHRIYFLTLLANLIVVPLATLAIWGGAALLVVALVVPGVAQSVSVVESGLLTALTGITGFFAQLPGGAMTLDTAAQSNFLVMLPWVMNVLLERPK